MMITISQIKAARLLLNWKQSDLARISGMALATIANLEQGKGTPRPHTLQVIRDSFEKFNIDFIEDHGVDLRSEHFNVKTLYGETGIFQTWESIESTLQETGGGEVLVSNVDHQLMYDKFKDDLEAMILRRPSLNIHLRGLVKEGDLVRIWPNEEFRTVPKKFFSGLTPVYIYANKTAVVNFKDSLRVVLIENKSVTDAFRQQFEFFWSTGKVVSKPIYMEK